MSGVRAPSGAGVGLRRHKASRRDIKSATVLSGQDGVDHVLDYLEKRSPARERRLVEPPRAPDLAPQRERLPELDPDLRPRLRAPARLQHHAQNAADAEPGAPEAGVDVGHLPFGSRDDATLIVRRQRSSSTVQSFCFTFNHRVVRPLSYALASSLATRPS